MRIGTQERQYRTYGKGTVMVEDLPPLTYFSTRSMQPISRTPGGMASRRLMYARATPRTARDGLDAFRDHSDVYDTLDKCHEDVQSACEDAAHKFSTGWRLL